MNWTPEQYDNLIRRRAQAAKPQHVVRDEPLATDKGKARDPRRYRVSIKSRRRRLLDPDNLVGGAKYVLDGCRYAGLIPGDSAGEIELVVTQEKSTKEETVITIESL